MTSHSGFFRHIAALPGSETALLKEHFRLRPVLSDLSGQLFHGAESALRPQILQQLYGRLPAVQVRISVQRMGFHRHLSGGDGGLSS